MAGPDPQWAPGGYRKRRGFPASLRMRIRTAGRPRWKEVQTHVGAGHPGLSQLHGLPKEPIKVENVQLKALESHPAHYQILSV